jgi:hypothetical protein
MRIVDSIPHPRLKISIFSLDTRWTVKFEDGPAEITLKYKKENFPNVEEVKRLVDESLLNAVGQKMEELKEVVRKQKSGHLDGREDEFPEII